MRPELPAEIPPPRPPARAPTHDPAPNPRPSARPNARPRARRSRRGRALGRVLGRGFGRVFAGLVAIGRASIGRASIGTVAIGLVAIALGASGCWKDDYAELSADFLGFRPAAGGPEGWVIASFEVGLFCPDGAPAPMFLLHPADASSGPLPVAILFSSGAFDYVFAPEPGDPLSGAHFAEPSRLEAGWATDQVFATLGMFDAPTTDDEIHDGRLPAAFAERGVAVALPTNCWGDLWANDPALHENDFAADAFPRYGRSAVEWAYLTVTDPAFAAVFDVELPVEIDVASVYAVGLGEGGRAVAELLSADNDGDGSPDYPVAGAIADSSPDDLRLYFDDAGAYASTVAGLSRVFPTGVDATASGSLWSAPLPDRFGIAYSTADPVLPQGILDAALQRTVAGHWVLEVDDPAHVLLNGGLEAEAAAHSAVEYLLTGAPPSRRR